MKGICTVLGTGTSQGVPVIACDCHVCSSKDPKDNRTRAAVMFSVNNENHVIDAGPDFRHQMLREKVKTLKCKRESKKGCNGKLTKCITHNLWDKLDNHINGFFENVKLEELVKMID